MNNIINDIIRLSFCDKVDINDTRLNYIKENYNESVKKEILDVCKIKKYTPFIAKFLINLDLDIIYWSNVKEHYSNRNNAILVFLTNFFTITAKKNINDIFVYENFGALLSSKTDISLFGSGDVDLLTSINNLQVIRKIFSELNFLETPNQSFFKMLRTTFRGTIHGEEFRLNIMFVPIVRYKLPIESGLSIEEITRTAVYYAETKIKIPSQEILLYLNCLRITAHTYVRSPDYRLYYDIYLLNDLKKDSSKLLKLARTSNNEIRVITVIETMKKLFYPYKKTNIKYKKLEKRVLLNLRIIFKDKDYLNVNAKKIELLKLEIFSYKKAVIRTLISLVFPNKVWINTYYTTNNKYLNGLLRYYKYVVFKKGWEK